MKESSPEKSGIPRWGDQVSIYPYQRNGRQEDMIVDTRPLRRIGKRSNQGKFGKQPNGTLFTVAMSPTSHRPPHNPRINHYRMKRAKKSRAIADPAWSLTGNYPLLMILFCKLVIEVRFNSIHRTLCRPPRHHGILDPNCYWGMSYMLILII